MQTVGTRAQVMHGTAKKTSGGLTSKDLKYNKSGHIVSRKVSALAKQQQKLKKAGYTTLKGQFGAVKIGSKHMKGGDKEYLLTIVKDLNDKPIEINLEQLDKTKQYVFDNTTHFKYTDNTDIRKTRINNITTFLLQKEIYVELREDGIKNVYGQEIKSMVKFKCRELPNNIELKNIKQPKYNNLKNNNGSKNIL